MVTLFCHCTVRRCRALLVASPLVAILLGGLVGCGPTPPGGDTPAGPQENLGTTAGGVEYKIYPLDKLPAATQVLPPLDGGTIEVTHPIGWKSMGRSKDYIVGISKTTAGDPPRIIITAKPLPDQTLGTVTLENFDDFLKLVETELAGELKENESPLEDIKALLLGDQPYARYVRRVGFKIRGKTLSGERQILRTLINNRLFTIELQTLPDKIFETRDDAYSLAAHLKVSGGRAPDPMPMPMPMDPAPPTAVP